jgi:acyl-coenzyme A synthetase/AMP-(fatty) acid ligase/acyl carrier protein
VYPIALASTPTIGVPLPGVRAYVLDRWLRPVPKGSPGFLYLAGDGVGRGYLDAPGATARVFVADPVAGDGRRMYATGDRVRVDRRGCLEYLGRADDQVKINGHRVELGEVDAAVRAHPEVSECAVLVDESEALHLFVVGADGTLTDWLANRLPSFMVPRRITQVPAIPLLPSGKVDRRRLLAMVEMGPTVEHPSSEVADLIADVWREVLRRPDITPADNFFSLGGHSLLAIRVVARVRKAMNLSLPISSIFEFPVLSDLADHIEQLRART